MKKILYFFPHKFSNLTDGCFVRCISLLQFFHERNIKVDFICFDNHSIQENYLLEKKLIDNLFLASPDTNKLHSNKFFRVYLYFLEILKNLFFPFKNLPDLLNKSLSSLVVDLCKKNNYDGIIVAYAYWGRIIPKIRSNGFRGKTIMDPNDFLTLQQLFSSNNKLPFNVIGNHFGSELERMNFFDSILHISFDEFSFFSSFLPNKDHHFVPQFFNPNFNDSLNDFTYDILFIGSSNIYNVEGFNWFLDEVYPLLSTNLRIGLAGTVCDKIERNYWNIEKLGFVDDASSLFLKTKVTICPLQRGTGIKIKVIESLSYGIPVISTFKGVDGFVNKNPLGGVLVGKNADEFASFILKITTDQDFYEYNRIEAQNLFNLNFSKTVNFKILDKIFST